MTRKPRHTNESAVEEHAHIDYESRIMERHLAVIERRALNDAICEDKRRVARILKDLETDISKKLIARKHGIPHHTVMYIWRNRNDNA